LPTADRGAHPVDLLIFSNVTSVTTALSRAGLVGIKSRGEHQAAPTASIRSPPLIAGALPAALRQHREDAEHGVSVRLRSSLARGIGADLRFSRTVSRNTWRPSGTWAMPSAAIR
jgi:hypothetical protein